MAEDDRRQDQDDDDGRPLSRTENRQVRKILAQNSAGVMLTGYLGKFVIFLLGVLGIVWTYLQIRSASK